MEIKRKVGEGDMSKEVFTKDLESVQMSEPQLDLKILRKRTSAKTKNGLVLSYAKKFRQEGNLEMAIFCQELYKQMFKLEKIERFQADQWRGKSSVNFLIEPHRVIVERYRRIDRHQKPIKVSSELTREEINRVIWAINELNKGKTIETSAIAETVYNKGWKLVFSTRKLHIKLVEILNYLEYRKDIHYSRVGKIKVLGQTKMGDFI